MLISCNHYRETDMGAKGGGGGGWGVATPPPKKNLDREFNRPDFERTGGCLIAHIGHFLIA